MKIPFGKVYLDKDIEFVLQVDRNYLIWATEQKNIVNKYPNEISFILSKLEISENQGENSNQINFGKYYLNTIEYVVLNDKSYSIWLLKKESFKKEYPKTYENLKKYFELIYENQNNHIIFYLLKFKNKEYIKIGHTKQYIVRRIYNYSGFSEIYRNDKIDFKNSFVYLTDDLNIELEILSEYKNYRLDKKSERLSCLSQNIIEYIDNKTTNKHFYSKKCLSDFIPFEDSFEFRDSFILKLNQFVNFEKHYIDHLKNINLFENYEPNFLGWNSN